MTRDEVVRGLRALLEGIPVQAPPAGYLDVLRAAVTLLTPPDPLPDDVRQAMFDAQKLVNEVQKKRISTLEAKLARVRGVRSWLSKGAKSQGGVLKVALQYLDAALAEADGRASGFEEWRP